MHLYTHAHRPRLLLVRERPATPPDPFTDADALEELGDEIATLAAHIHAATQRMLELIADFDRRRGWELGGHRSCAHWLAYRTGIALPAAREKVRAARALVDLPETRAAMARGELSFSQVRALTRVADPDNEADLLELARGCTTAQIERLVRGWKLGSLEDEVAREEHRHASRTLSIVPDHDGMYVLRGRLEPEVGALLMKAIEAAGDVLFRADEGAGREADTGAAAARRRADALALLAERVMAAGFGGSAGGGADDGADDEPDDARGDARGDVPGAGSDRAAAGEPVDAVPVPLSGTRAERYQVMLHVDAGTLGSGEASAPTRSHLHDGTRVSAETSRRLSCDAARVCVTHGAPRGETAGPTGAPILSVGRRTRTIPPALRRALEARDRGCRFPGCGLPYTDAHHVRHWADGGETSLANTLLLCRHHHRLVHEGGWTVRWWGEGRPTFVDPRGFEHYEGGWAPPEGVDLDALLAEDRADRGLRPDGWTAAARWRRTADIPDELLFRALEAVG